MGATKVKESLPEFFDLEKRHQQLEKLEHPLPKLAKVVD